MTSSRSLQCFLGSAIPCVVAGCIALLCVLLAPSDRSSDRRLFSYEFADTGQITWRDSVSRSVKLQVQSNIRSQICDDFSVACADDIQFLQRSSGDVECYDVQSAKTIIDGHEEIGDKIMVEDCISMQTTRGGENVFWYGGAQLYQQKWPINNVQMDFFSLYLSTDLPWRYGNVLERYWISSSGVAIFVYSEVPLLVSHTAGEKMCLRAEYNSTVVFGRRYHPTGRPGMNATVLKTELRYAVCLGYDAVTAQKAMLKSSSNADGFINRPSGLPDTKMLKDPIWSTWARYKSRINQTIIENFADEIKQRNFTNCQLEIDDGYETEYGDFTFDPEKFPDAPAMIQSLHSKGFRVTTWVTHFVNTRSRNYLPGRVNGYFIRQSSDDQAPSLITWWNGVGAVVDFTNNDAATWYESVLQDVKQLYGIDSFKFDAGETNYIPRNGWTQEPMINPGEFTSLYARSAYKEGGNIMEMRSAWRLQSYPFYMRMMDKGSRWGGFKGLRTLIPTALTFGIIGYPYVLPDMVGGNAYGGLKPDRELFIRWLEINAFMPVIQFSITPWDYDKELTEIALNYTELHRTIVYEEIARAAEKYISGESIHLPVSPIWYVAAPDETAAFVANDEFLVGDRYLVAPVVWEGERKRDIYLPKGMGERPIVWRDMLRIESSTRNVEGGIWLRSYMVDLHEISWWERL